MKRKIQMTSLFDSAELELFESPPKPEKKKRPKPDSKKLATRAKKKRMAESGRQARVGEVVGELEHGQTLHVVSAAEWSTHNLIEHLCQQTGPVVLWLVTWSISEDGVRVMLRLRESGAIVTMHALTDWRVLVRNRDAVQLMKNNADTFAVAPCHAKLYVMTNEDWAITIVSSANLTNNPRLETMVITEDREVAEFHTRWINAMIANSKRWEDVLV